MKFKTLTKYSVNITNILFFGTIISGIGRIFFSSDIFLILYAAFSLILILNELRYLKFTAPLVLFTFILLLVFLMLWLKMIMGLNTAFYVIHHFIIGSFLAHAIFRGSIKKQTALLIFFIVAGYFIYNLTLVDVSGETLDEIMQKRNSISVLVISCLMVLVFLNRQGNASAPLIPAFAYVIVSIGATGRSGIISSLVIFLAMIFNADNLQFTRTKKIIGYFTIITAVSVAIFIYREELMNMANILMPYLMSKGFKDEARTYMILSYLQRITPLSLIFGVDLESIHFLTQYNYNPHNSYIKLHAVLGVVSFLFYIPLVYYLFKELLARHVVYVICILAYLFRIGTDSVVGSNVLSFVFLTLILYGINSAVKKSNKNLTHLLGKKTNPIVAKTASDHG